MKQVEIFTGPMCGYCVAAKRMLDKLGFEYTERSISDPEVLREMRERFPNARTVPQIIIDGEHIGGFDDLSERYT
jgi:glutaredoxin 3